MIYGDVELHNVADLEELPDGGVRLQRCPEELRLLLNESGKSRMRFPSCSEIRFVAESPTVRVTISCSEGAAQVVPFFGMFQGASVYVAAGEKRTIELTPAENFLRLDPAACADMPFSPRVFRFMLGIGGIVEFHGVEGEGVRPPQADELPSVRYLAYGTSITDGSAATGPHLTYVAQAARRLGVDLINLGLGGGAHCEPELADWIAARDDWHIATLAMSVNMIGAGFSLEDFHDRVAYFMNTVAGADTSRPVACITIYPHSRDFPGRFDAPQLKGTPEQYRQALRDAVGESGLPNVHLIEGPEMLTDPAGLTPDLVHPADNGMIMMGENLARELKPVVDSIRGAA